MKACFYLQRRFAFLGHQMAVLLKEKYGVDDFCGYVAVRSGYNFLREQQDIKYSNLILEEDVYGSYKNEKIDSDFLNKFAKEYGIPNLWPFITIDRILRHNLLLRSYPSDESKYSHEDLIKIFQVTAKAVVKFLDDEKPDFIFFSVVGNLGTCLLYEVAKKKNIKILLTCDPRIGAMQTLSESYGSHSYISSTIQHIKDNRMETGVKEYYEKAISFVREFQAKPFYYMKESAASQRFSQKVAEKSYHFSFLLPKNISRSIRWFFKSYYDYFLNKNNDKDDYSTIKPWWENWDKFVRKMRIFRGYRDLYDKVDFSEKYAYFTLHSEPEALFPLSAPFFTDQQWVIAQVARSLPLEFKLYVKDHPQMIGKRPRSYYKKIKKIPNVKLIDPAVDSLELNKNSKIAITVTGTAGWEGVLLEKPVIVFGNVFYSALSTVKVCSDITKLPFLVKNQLENFVYNEDELVYFVAGLFKESASIDLSQIWDVEGVSNMENKKKALEPLIDLLAKKLHIDKK